MNARIAILAKKVILEMESVEVVILVPIVVKVQPYKKREKI